MNGSSPLVGAPLRILHVNTADIAGGAEKYAVDLMRKSREAGHHVWLAVGRKRSTDPGTFVIPNDVAITPWGKAGMGLASVVQPWTGRFKAARRAHRTLKKIALPGATLDRWRGREDFRHPGTSHVLGLSPELPDLIHCHNLHGGYFDLRILPWLSHRLPVVLTLHDEWMLTGHCAYTLGCERWQVGCGACPDLTIYPAIRRDGTAQNWKIKQDVYRRSRLFVTTPSQSLMDQATRSSLSAGMIDTKVIHNGVDTAVFRPRDRTEVRRELGLPSDRPILLFAANRVRTNRFKDFATVRRAMHCIAAEGLHRDILLLALGEDAPPDNEAGVEVRFVPFEKNSSRVARYYQAADVYLHAAHSEVWGLTITEALACGTPVVATAVGGIPEQIRDLQARSDAATGVLVRPGDAKAMAHAVIMLLSDDALRRRLSDNAARDAGQRFDLNKQAEKYLTWYSFVLEECQKSRRPECG